MPKRELKPFFCFYGGKWRAAPHYPAPTFSTIVEPFAGAAGYATRHHNRDVILVERDATIAALWRWLIEAPAREIRALPTEIGFWLNHGVNAPRQSPSAWMRAGKHKTSFWGVEIRERIASQVDEIKHWRVIEGHYAQAPDVTATWFIDPPYSNAAGRLYRHRQIDYSDLSQWCRSRRGQVMVCENVGADWLPFQEHRQIKSMEGARGKKKSAEALWRSDSNPDNDH